MLMVLPGAVGLLLGDGLLDRGHRVRVVYQFLNDRSTNLEQFRNKIEMIAADLFHPDSFDSSILEGVKYLFHFAVPSTPTSSLLDPIGEFQNHLLPTIRLFDIARKIGEHRVLFPSSGGTVYGQRPRCPVTEDTPLQPITPHSIVKVTLEDYLNFLHLQRDCPLDSIVYRIGNPYGPNQRGWIKKQGVISAFLRAALLDEPVRLIGAGKTVRHYIFIDDVVQANIACIERGSLGTYNIGTGIATSVEILYGKICEVINKQNEKTYLPKRAGELDRNILNIKRAARKLNWKPTINLKEGLLRTYEWFKQQ